MQEIVLVEIGNKEAYEVWNAHCDALHRPDLKLDWGAYGYVHTSLDDLFQKLLTLTRLMAEVRQPMGDAEKILEKARVELRVHRAVFQGE